LYSVDSCFRASSTKPTKKRDWGPFLTKKKRFSGPPIKKGTLRNLLEALIYYNRVLSGSILAR